MNAVFREGMAATEEKSYSLFYRFLRLFIDIRPGEMPKALLLTLNIFLILMAYYILKPIRETLLLVDAGAPAVKSYLSAAQAILFIFVIKGFSRLSSQVPRHLLITWTTLFFISNIIIFYFLNIAGMPIKTMGIMFFIWIGIFNYFIVAQFWSFANDLYSYEVGKRIFPLIAVGANLGAIAGTQSKYLRNVMGNYWEYKLMLLAGAVLFLCIMLARYIHKREIRRIERLKEVAPQEAEARKSEEEEPLKKGGGFQLVLKSRYLLYIALLIGLYNFINATGEYILTDVQTRAAIKAVESETADSPEMQPMSPEEKEDAMKKYIHSAFSGYQALTNIIALVIQLFLVSRIFKWVGIGGALLFLPTIALFGYGYMTFGVALVLVRWVKSIENGTDYSLMNTTKAALFLVTSREEKYKAKCAIDTFFVRGGDTTSAIAVFLGTQVLSLAIEKYALFNVVAVVVWIVLCFLIIREYKRIKAKTGLAQTG